LLSGWGKTIAVLLLLAASAASASPTVISELSVGTDNRARIISSTGNTDGVVGCVLDSATSCDRLSEFAGSLLRPPLTDGPATSDDYHYLPAVPPALLMVLTGFLCISFVRDRRTWVAVLAGLFALGQTGFNILPELSRVSRKVHNCRTIEPELTALYISESSFYQLNYTNETRYTGLLHHLAGIPQNTSVFSHIRKIVIPSEAEESVLIRGFHSAGKDTRVSQAAFVLGQLALSKLSNCLVSGTRRFNFFQPALIFCRIPRGPPISS
jgi:hypothetical protein